MRITHWLSSLTLLALVAAPALSQPQGPFANTKPGHTPAVDPYQMMVRQLTQQALKTASELCQEGMYQQAEYLLRKVERINPGNPEIHHAIKAVRFVSGADHNVFNQPHEPRDLPNICDRPGSCAVVAPPHPALSKEALRDYLVSIGNRTVPTLPPCTGAEESSDRACCSPKGCSTGRCPTTTVGTSNCPCAIKTTTRANCPCSAAEACAKECKCSSESCCCVAKCGCGKTCACTKQCGCGKECACKQARTTSTYLPPAGNAVIWVMPTSGVNVHQCPVLNKTLRGLAPRSIKTQWIYQGDSVRQPTPYRSVVGPVIRTHPVPPMRVTVSEEYRQHGPTGGAGQRAVPNMRSEAFVPFVEVLPEDSGGEESEPRGPVRVQFLPTSGVQYQVQPTRPFNPYKPVPTPNTNVRVFDFYTGIVR